MAATLKEAITLLIICTANSILSAESETSPDNVVYACQGTTARLPWKLDVDRKAVMNASWFFQGAGSKVLVALYSKGQFLTCCRNRWSLFNFTGLALFGVRKGQQGNYTLQFVTTGTDLTSSLPVSHSQSVFLLVGDGLIVRRSNLTVRQSLVPSLDTTSKQWTITLLCGIFTFRGQAPIDVDWILPSGKVRGSSGYKEGWFYLSLTLPSAHAGKYTCSIPRQFYPKVCLPPRMENVINTEASTILDKVKVLEARAESGARLRMPGHRRKDTDYEIAQMTTPRAKTNEEFKDELKQIHKLVQADSASKEEMKDELKQIQTLLQLEYSSKEDMKKKLKHVQEKLKEQYTTKEDMKVVLKHVQTTLRTGNAASKEDLKKELKQIQTELQKTLKSQDKTQELLPTPMIPIEEYYSSNASSNYSSNEEITNEIKKIQKLLKEEYATKEEMRNELRQIQKLLKAEYASKQDIKKEIDDVEKKLEEQYTSKQDMKSFVDQIQKTLREEQASTTEDMKKMLKEMEMTLRKDLSSSEKGITNAAQTGNYTRIQNGDQTGIHTEIKNVALHRPAVQSSTFKAFGYANYAGLAVDGNRDSDFKKGSCIYTGHRHNARSWWQVDLGLRYNIISVVITNRGDGDGSKLRNFDVSVHHRNPIHGATGGAFAICYHHTGAMKQGATENFTCNNGPINGRFVRLTNAAGNPLHVCEVEVIAKTKI